MGLVLERCCPKWERPVGNVLTRQLVVYFPRQVRSDSYCKDQEEQHARTDLVLCDL